MLSIAFESKRCSMFHIGFKTKETKYICKVAREPGVGEGSADFHNDSQSHSALSKFLPLFGAKVRYTPAHRVRTSSRAAL